MKMLSVEALEPSVHLLSDQERINHLFPVKNQDLGLAGADSHPGRKPPQCTLEVLGSMMPT